jgi:non-heme chloroperoxidase
MPAGYVAVDQGQIYYNDVGHGARTIVWIHGLPLNGDAWRAQIEHFAPHYRNVVIDLRGYGRSSKLPPDVVSVTDLYVSDLRRLFASLDIGRAIVVGFASGGHGAIRFSAIHGELVERLALINASPRFRRGVDWPWGFDQTAIAAVNENLSRWGLAVLSDLLLDPGTVFQDVDATLGANLAATYRQMCLEAGAETISAFFNNIAEDDDRALLPRISAPTLAITASLDREVPPAVGIFLRQEIPNAYLMEIPGADHFVFATRAKLINCILEAFFRDGAESEFLGAVRE